MHKMFSKSFILLFFFQIFIISRSTGILSESNFGLGLYVVYILNLRLFEWKTTLAHICRCSICLLVGGRCSFISGRISCWAIPHRGFSKGCYEGWTSLIRTCDHTLRVILELCQRESMTRNYVAKSRTREIFSYWLDSYDFVVSEQTWDWFSTCNFSTHRRMYILAERATLFFFTNENNTWDGKCGDERNVFL